MQLRRFTADTTPAALSAVRRALGDDAIILANRKIGDQVEIIATEQMDDAQSFADISLDNLAIEPAQTADEHLVLPGKSDRQSSEPQPADHKPGSPTTIEKLTAAIDAVEQKVEPVQFGSTTAAEQEFRQATRGRIGKSTVSSRPVNGSTTKKRPAVIKGVENQALQREIQNVASSVDESVAVHNRQLMEVIEAQTSMLNQYFKGMEVNLWGNSSPNRRLHLQKLFALGIGAEMAIQLVERSNPEHTLDEALRHSFALLKSTLPIGKDKTFIEPGVTILSGPPGAGKTTALMKIATQHVREHGNDSIVIICADTRRIGAFEELQAYGRLLGVPTVHAHDSSELDSLLNAFTHKQLVLIDHTLPDDEDALEIPPRLLNAARKNSVRQLMVLSATAQASTIDALIREHCQGRTMQCVLTHLDANARLGELFSALIRHHLPIAYWSDAASVQKPLQKADASVLIATAVAMSRRLVPTPDDDWLLRLIQPSDKLMPQPLYKPQTEEVS